MVDDSAHRTLSSPTSYDSPSPCFLPNSPAPFLGILFLTSPSLPSVDDSFRLKVSQVVSEVLSPERAVTRVWQERCWAQA